VLDVPEEFFYAKSDEAAALLIAYHRASPARKRQIVELAKHPE
jgi:hypothetical protein